MEVSLREYTMMMTRGVLRSIKKLMYGQRRVRLLQTTCDKSAFHRRDCLFLPAKKGENINIVELSLLTSCT